MSQKLRLEMKRTFFKKIIIGTTLTVIPLILLAGTTTNRWYHGETWECKLGKSQKMEIKYAVVDDNSGSCDGDNCTSSSGVKTVSKSRIGTGNSWTPWITSELEQGNNKTVVAVDEGGSRLTLNYRGKLRGRELANGEFVVEASPDAISCGRGKSSIQVMPVDRVFNNRIHELAVPIKK
jgi:Family of unknown function (DUF6006)